MKALIVSDELQDSKNIQTSLEQAGYDTICYRWLLKALDNVEEIQPHLVVINAVDYPRHWKVLLQHIKCNLKEQPRVILLVPAAFEAEESEKARILGVLGCITGTGKIQMERLHQLLKGQESLSPPPSDGAKILFVHPHEGVLYSGQLADCGDERYHLSPDRPVLLRAGDVIADGSLKTSEGIKSIRAAVLEDEPELVVGLE